MVAQIEDYFKDSDNFFLKFPHFKYGNLKKYIEFNTLDLQVDQLAFKCKLIYQVFFQLCLGLDYLDQNGYQLNNLDLTHILIDEKKNLKINNLSQITLSTSQTREYNDQFELGKILFYLLTRNELQDDQDLPLRDGIDQQAYSLIKQLLQTKNQKPIRFKSIFDHPWIEEKIKEFDFDFLFYDKFQIHFSQLKDLIKKLFSESQLLLLQSRQLNLNQNFEFLALCEKRNRIFDAKKKKIENQFNLESIFETSFIQINHLKQTLPKVEPMKSKYGFEDRDLSPSPKINKIKKSFKFKQPETMDQDYIDEQIELKNLPSPIVKCQQNLFLSQQEKTQINYNDKFTRQKKQIFDMDKTLNFHFTNNQSLNWDQILQESQLQISIHDFKSSQRRKNLF